MTVQFPGSRSYNQIGEPENAEELAEVSPENIVKVAGSRTACENAIKEMSVSATENVVMTKLTTLALGTLNPSGPCYHDDHCSLALRPFDQPTGHLFPYLAPERRTG